MSDELALEDLFPNLRQSAYRVTSPRSFNYNCIAWAAGRDDGVWEPTGYYWPRRISRDGSVKSLVAVFKSLGYVVCDNDAAEPGIEKVAIYGHERGTFTHAARQLDSGTWTSKLGRLEDIEHDSLRALEGTEYGVVACVMKRPQQKRAT